MANAHRTWRHLAAGATIATASIVPRIETCSVLAVAVHTRGLSSALRKVSLFIRTRPSATAWRNLRWVYMIMPQVQTVPTSATLVTQTKTSSGTT